MRQVERSPLGVVKLWLRKTEVTGLGEIPLIGSKVEVLRRIGGVPLEKSPVEVEQKMLSGSQIDLRNSLDHPSVFSLFYRVRKQL